MKKAFETYVQLYYTSGDVAFSIISQEKGLAIILQNLVVDSIEDGEEERACYNEGLSWDTIHSIEFEQGKEDANGKSSPTSIKLASTAIVRFGASSRTDCPVKFEVSGSVTQLAQRSVSSLSATTECTVTIGQMV